MIEHYVQRPERRLAFKVSSWTRVSNKRVIEVLKNVWRPRIDQDVLESRTVFDHSGKDRDKPCCTLTKLAQTNQFKWGLSVEQITVNKKWFCIEVWFLFE